MEDNIGAGETSNNLENRIKLKIYSKVLALRNKHHIYFLDDYLYGIKLTWCFNFDAFSDVVYYSANAACIHELQDMSSFLSDSLKSNELPSYNLIFECNGRCKTLDSPF